MTSRTGLVWGWSQSGYSKQFKNGDNRPPPTPHQSPRSSGSNLRGLNFLLFQNISWKLSTGSKGCYGRMLPCPFFQFHAVFGKNNQNNRLGHPSYATFPSPAWKILDLPPEMFHFQTSSSNFHFSPTQLVFKNSHLILQKPNLISHDWWYDGQFIVFHSLYVTAGFNLFWL